MADKIRFGIVGLGMGRHRAGLATQTPGAELAAVCDTWEERGQQTAEELNCDWLRDYDDLLARDDVDCVGIFTPSGMHADFARRALEAGKHAFTTKPLDIRTEACDAAIAAAEASGLLLAVDFESRYLPINHRIRAALQAGSLGRIILADLRLKWYRGQDYYDGGHPAGWRSRLETEGGSLINQAVHYLDLLQWWLGPVEQVVGRRGTFSHAIETEDATVSLLQFASGAWGVAQTTTCSFPDLGTSIELTGTRGTIAWRDNKLVLWQAMADASGAGEDQPGYVRPELAGKPEPMEVCPEDYPAPEDLPANIIEDMVAALTRGTPVQCSAPEGRKTVAIIEAVYGSAETGQPVRLG